MQRLSYKWRLILSSVLFISLIEATVITVDTARAYVERSSFLSQRARFLVRSSAEALRVPVWNFDKDTAQNILQSLVLDPDIVSAEVRYAESLPPIRVTGTRGTDGFLIAETILASAPGSGVKQSVGSVNITFTRDRLDRFLFQRVNEALLELALLVAVNFALIILVVRWMAGPLVRLSGTMERLAADDFGVEVPETSRRDEIGAMARAVATFKDNGIKLRHLQESMERKISEQTRDLVAAKEAAEAAARAKSRFLATMSHEIRTPMNGVLGMAQVLESSPLGEDQRECVEVILKSGRALLDIIDDVLDFSKLEASAVELEQIPFDLERVAHDVLQLLAPATGGKELELILDYDPACPRHFHGDPGRLRQILLNLAGNALKFTATGHVRIAVECDADTDPGLGGPLPVTLSVEDTGIGVAADKLALIFDAFTQADQATTREYGGTGLGLSITRKLVERMGGAVEVASAPGKGSTFRLHLQLPLAETPLPPPRTAIAGIRVLAVDDHHENLRILDRLLRHLGAEPTLLTDPTEAVPALTAAAQAGNPFRIAVLDHHMPGLSGLDLGRAIRREPGLADLRLLILSSAGQKGHARQFRREQFDGYLNKPFHAGTLGQMLARLLERQEGDDLVTRHSVEESLQAASAEQRFAGRVLLVEDVLANQKVATVLLRRLGLTVDVAGDGAEALARWSPGRYDLILMDCRMPRMDGYQATRSVRAAERGARVPILALTANASEDDHRRCREAGMDGVLTKPFQTAELARALEPWLGAPGHVPTAALPKAAEAPLRRVTLDTAVFESQQTELAQDFPDLIEAFFQTAEESLSRLERGPDDLDQEETVRLFHSLKSACANVGAASMGELAGELESATGQGALSDLPVRIGALGAEYGRVRRVIEALTSADA